LDTPIFSEIDKQTQGVAGAQITLDEVRVLRDAIREGKITVRPSPVVLAEPIDGIEADRAAMVRRLRIMRDLHGGFQGMLNEPSRLLRETVRAFAEGAPSRGVTFPEDEQREMVNRPGFPADSNP
jgi:hypothetical protein